MSRDRIQEAVESGQKNLRTWELVRNWCAHVKMRKHGGTGIVETQTGLPIGHHFLECPHAPASGMAAFDLADTALDFYDRNCVDCKFRQPVGIPNISSLVAERDAKKKAQQEEQARRDQEIAAQLAGREAARQKIRQSLGALPATTLDQISELDRTRSDDAAVKVAELAELAPETFVPEIVEHLFALLESKEHWLVEPCLKALAALRVDDERLCRAALRALRSYSAREVAAEILRERAAHADPDLIPAALSSLISLANPISSPFGGRARRPIKAPLETLYKAQPLAVRAGLKELFEKTDAYDVQIAARGLECLAVSDPSILEFLTPQLVSKVVRANHLVKGREDDVREALDDIRSVLTHTFVAKPVETDALIGAYLQGASGENAAELYKVYDEVLHDVRFNHDEQAVAITEAHRLAFRRMVVVATQTRDDEIADATQSLFHGDPYALTPLVSAELNLLLGSAAVLDTKLTEFEAEKPERADELYFLQRMGRRSYLANLMHTFVRWACTAAGKDGEKAIAEVLAFMHALPEGSVRLRATFVAAFDRLMVSTDALAQCLPDYYSALVGPEQLIRSDAATVMGEIKERIRENFPSLVFEAFAALLTDPYTIVHQAAVRALGRLHLPESLDGLAARALGNIITAYANDRGKDEFLMAAIDLYAGRYAKKARLAGTLGNTLIATMQKMEPYAVAREIRHSGRLYTENETYPALLLRLMADQQAMSLYHEDLFRQLKLLPRRSVHAHRKGLLELGKRLSGRPQHLHDVGLLLERLTAAGAWKEAAELSNAAYSDIEDTIRNRPVRLHAKLRMLACSFEEAVSQGVIDGASSLRGEWDSTLAEIEQDHEVNRRRRDPLKGLLDSR